MTQSEALEILKSGQNVFLTGEPGAGKTFTINQFIEWLRQTGRRYAITASTGIAATHIGGVTIHSWTGIRMKRRIDINSLGTLEQDRFLVERIQRPQVLIIDEISMLDANFIDMIDVILRHFRDGSRSFGGIQVVFVGDFFQLPPVTKSGPTKFAFQSDAWEEANLKVCYLTEQHRQLSGPFLSILHAMRSGSITSDHKSILADTRNIPESEEPKTHLFTHNADVDVMNNAELGKLEGATHTYKMEITAVHPVVADILKKQCLSPEILDLKEGAVVMFTRNNFDKGYVNGTIGSVTGFDTGGAPIVLTKDGNRIVPEKQEWRLEENGKVKATAKQIPLRLAWAITVHKSQGMSLDEAVVDLSNCFEYGQGYVAISRVRSLEGLKLVGINDKAFLMHPKVVRKDAEFRKAI